MAFIYIPAVAGDVTPTIFSSSAPSGLESSDQTGSEGRIGRIGGQCVVDPYVQEQAKGIDEPVTTLSVRPPAFRGAQ